MSDLWTGIGILCILVGVFCIMVGYFIVTKLPDILERNASSKLEAEKERTRQKELDLKTAQLKTGERTMTTGDNKKDA